LTTATVVRTKHNAGARTESDSNSDSDSDGDGDGDFGSDGEQGGQAKDALAIRQGI
jgi:hypothetical protein